MTGQFWYSSRFKIGLPPLMASLSGIAFLTSKKLVDGGPTQ
jgi:hypothetical protein